LNACGCLKISVFVSNWSFAHKETGPKRAAFALF
jgi:hypothetical protein